MPHTPGDNNVFANKRQKRISVEREYNSRPAPGLNFVIQTCQIHLTIITTREHAHATKTKMLVYEQKSGLLLLLLLLLLYYSRA